VASGGDPWDGTDPGCAADGRGFAEGAAIAEALHDTAATVDQTDAVLCHSQGCAALTYAIEHHPTLSLDYSLMIAVAPSAYKNASVEGFIESGGQVVLLYDSGDAVGMNSRVFLGWNTSTLWR
jgi:hypothetical protein